MRNDKLHASPPVHITKKNQDEKEHTPNPSQEGNNTLRKLETLPYIVKHQLQP